MTVCKEAMAKWCRMILEAEPGEKSLTLEDCVNAIPKLDDLSDVPSGTPVLIRGDVDAKPGATIGEGDIRLRSMKETIEFGREKGWIQIIFGHIGRQPEGSLDKVRDRLTKILNCEIPLIEDWLDPETTTVTDEVVQAIRSAKPGTVIMLQNTRKYDIERALWKATAESLPTMIDSLTKLANEVAEKIAKVYVHEAFSAGNRDASSVVIPAAMERVAFGKYIAEQFSDHLAECLKAQLVVFSGLKIDKLDSLEAMINRGKIKHVITAGSVAMSLKKAAANLDGKEFDLGMSEDPANAGKSFYIPLERIEQAKKMLVKGKNEGVEFVMPVDFVLEDGSVSEVVGPGRQQFDVGPKSREHFAAKVGAFIEEQTATGCQGVVFDNGVFGMFEDPRFEAGTKSFTEQLKRMTDAGVKVYVGGGEGGKAVEKYGQPDWITYCFTAGGTVLKTLGGKTIPYLMALKMAAER